MKINNKFLTYEELGRRIMSKLAIGYELIVFYDKFGNGYMEFHRDDCCPAVVEFTEMKVEDEVEISYNELGKLVKI